MVNRQTEVQTKTTQVQLFTFIIFVYTIRARQWRVAVVTLVDAGIELFIRSNNDAHRFFNQNARAAQSSTSLGRRALSVSQSSQISQTDSHGAAIVAFVLHFAFHADAKMQTISLANHLSSIWSESAVICALLSEYLPTRSLSRQISYDHTDPSNSVLYSKWLMALSQLPREA